MRMSVRLVAIALLVAPVFAADHPDFRLWKADELARRNAALSKKVGPDHSSRETLADFGDHRVRFLHRNADGFPEQHDNIVDLVFVQSGEGVLQLGGTVIDKKATGSPGEFAGSRLEGGSRHPLGAGDVIHIPATVPHAFLVQKGKHLTYVLVKFPEQLLSATPFAQGTQRFEIDPYWPRPLPDKWIIGRTGSICADAHDHLIVTNRRDITAEEAETSVQAPSVLIFDLAGNLVQSFGDSSTVPGTIHGCFVDHEHNIWVTGNGDGIIQKWSHDGKLLLQIGKRGVFDTTDGTAKGQRLNAGRAQFFNPAGLVVDPANGDVYVADGYGNRRVAVFDRHGNFLRQWGRQGTQEEIEAGTGGAFAQIVHCIAMSRAGLIYVCDRQGQRVQVFDKAGRFVRNIWIRTGTPALPDPRGTAWWVAFSRDPEQKFMYVMNGRNEQLHILDHASGKLLSSFGRPGHWLGNFTHGHAVTVDSHGNLYIAETDTGRRVQKFTLVK